MEHEVHALFNLAGLEVTSRVTTMWGIMIILLILSFLATRNLKRVPSGVQNVMELVIEGLLNFFSGILGRERAREFFPFLATLFLLIVFSNYSGLIPGAGHITGLAAPTSTWSITVAWALLVFIATHFYGIKKRGLSYFKHFVQPVFFMLPLNIVEEFIKPLSLSLRLYGNVFGEEMIIAFLLSMVPYFLPLPMMALSVLFCLVQAFVFVLLTAVYLSLSTADEH